MSPLRLGSPAIYRVTIQGCLDDRWSDDLGGVTITHTVDTAGHTLTILTGHLVDQAALFGLLNGVYGLGFPLLAVECLAIKEVG